MDLNNRNLGTHSNKIRKIAKINTYICNQIDKNQNIKRYCRYLTKSPLSKNATDLNGDKVVQPDLLNSLMIDSDEGKQVLFKGSFDEDIQAIEQTFIFVHTYDGNFNDVTGKLRVAVSFICNNDREQLKYDEESRSTEVTIEISDFLDMMSNEEYIDDIGNLTFKLVNYKHGRVSKTNSMLLTTLFLEVGIVTMRSR